MLISFDNISGNNVYSFIIVIVLIVSAVGIISACGINILNSKIINIKPEHFKFITITIIIILAIACLYFAYQLFVARCKPMTSEQFYVNPRTSYLPNQLPTVYSKDIFYGKNKKEPGYVAGIAEEYSKTML